MEMANGIVLVMGLPATGKSTFCKALAVDHTVTIWSLDDYPNIGTLKEKNDSIFKAVSNALCKNSSSIHIVDDTFHLRSMRKRYVGLSRERKIGLAIIYLGAPLKELLDRNRNRDYPVTDSAIMKMMGYFEPLCTSHRCYLVSAAASNIWHDILDTLIWSKNYHDEIAETINFNAIEPQSTAHKMFLLLNQAVSLIVMEADPDRRKLVAHSLIPIKQMIYTKLKSQIHDETILRAIHEDNPSYFKTLLLDNIDEQQ